MNRLALALLLTAFAPPAAAQVSPTPWFDDPRLQTIAYDPARPVRLVAFPGSNLTVMLLPGDRIERVVMSDQGAFDVRVAGANDSLNIVPLRADAIATLLVDTSVRRYEFELATGEGLTAAYVVRFVPPSVGDGGVGPLLPAPDVGPLTLTGEYKLTGAMILRPSRIVDDGARTYIEWAENQSLPAVFGIGPTGQEEVVDGYMREGVFTIDRVYGELVFRIDKERAKARRLVESNG